MAVVSFAPVPMNIEGDMYRAVIATGDSTGKLTVNGGENEVTVHLYGTAGGSTTVVRGYLDPNGVSPATMDDAYGTAMSYTVMPQIKPVGPAVTALDAACSAGAGTVTVDVYIVRKVRP